MNKITILYNNVPEMTALRYVHDALSSKFRTGAVKYPGGIWVWFPDNRSKSFRVFKEPEKK